MRTSLMNRYLALAVLLLLMSSSASGQPSITNVIGSYDHGETIIIVGSGFGSKATAAPVKYDDFESGANGSLITTWEIDVGGTPYGTGVKRYPEHSNGRTRTGSNISALTAFEHGQYLNTFGVYPFGDQGLPHVYYDAWFYIDRPVGSQDSRNHKMIRLYPYLNSGLPNTYPATVCYRNTIFFTGDSDGDQHDYSNYTVDETVQNWTHIQAYLETSDEGVQNGVLKWWINGELVADRNDWQSKRTGYPADWGSVWFGNYYAISEGPACPQAVDTDIYWDNVYVDNTQQRVEIGNNISYNSCTIREIQIPSQWMDTSISVELNAGGFASEANVYVFVVDPSGNISSGEPITLGQVVEGDNTAPPIPTWTAGSYYAGDGFCYLDWNPVTDEEGGSGLAGYEVFRSDEDASNFVSVSSIVQSEWTDTYVTNGTKYFYKVRSRDNAGNTSELSAYIDLTPTGSPLTLGNPTTDHAVGLTDGH